MPTVVHQRNTLHEGRVFTLSREHVTLENGFTTDLDIIRHPGAAAVVPFLDPGTIVLLRQYRHAVSEFLWEIPAGTLAPGEAPFACAQRELTEETGYTALTWHPLGVIVPVPAYSDERIHLYLAMDLLPVAQELDRDEILEVHRLPLDRALEMAKDGEIYDSKTLSGLFLAHGWLKSLPPHRHP